MSDMLPGFEPPPPPEQLSAGVRATRRGIERVQRGLHPVAPRALLRTREPDSTATCGGCEFLIGKQYGKTYWKCTMLLDQRQHGPDITKKWPACTEFKPLPDGEKPPVVFMP